MLSSADRHEFISVRAFFMAEEQRSKAKKRGDEGFVVDDAANWLAAEYETDREEECVDLSRKLCRRNSDEDAIRLHVLYWLSFATKIKPSQMPDTTPLPENTEQVESVCYEAALAVGRVNIVDADERCARLITNVKTVGELIAAIIAADRICLA
jgi:hypothetical protein